jgi:hypothetical protein
VSEKSLQWTWKYLIRHETEKSSTQNKRSDQASTRERALLRVQKKGELTLENVRVGTEIQFGNPDRYRYVEHTSHLLGPAARTGNNEQFIRLRLISHFGQSSTRSRAYHSADWPVMPRMSKEFYPTPQDGCVNVLEEVALSRSTAICESSKTLQIQTYKHQCERIYGECLNASMRL